MPKQLNSEKFQKKKKSFPRTKNEIFCKRKKDFFHKRNLFFLQDTNYSCASIFIIHAFISYIFKSLF